MTFNCFEVRIGLMAFLLAATVGTVLSIAYGYEDRNDFQKIQDYCFAHADDINAGGNPVNDLLSAGLISSEFTGKNCSDISWEKFKYESRQQIMEAFNDD